MTAPGQNVGGLSGGLPQKDPAEVTNQLYLAIDAAAKVGAVTQTPGEMDQAAGAALKFAQALVILDPSLAQGGTPLAHDLALKAQDGQNQLAVTQAQGAASIQQEQIRAEAATKAAAAAPTPSKKKTVAVRRDSAGNPSTYDITEG